MLWSMNASDATLEALVWTDEPRAGLVERVLGKLPEVSVLAVGCPRRGGITELARQFDAEAGDDLRKMLVDHPARFLLLATAEAVNQKAAFTALESGTDVLAVEPPGAAASQAIVIEPTDTTFGRLVPTPWLRLSRPLLAAAEPEQVYGQAQSASAVALGPPEAGSLLARLFDVFDITCRLFGMPAMIDAALAGPLAKVPDDLRGLTGHLTANLHLQERAAATVHASDRAAVWHRRLDVLGDAGQLSLNDRGYRLHNADGTEMDAMVENDGGPVDPAELIARQWRWMIDHPGGPVPADRREVLACCQAAMLSCRTAQPESPGMFVRISRA